MWVSGGAQTGALSGGELQRVLLALATIRFPIYWFWTSLFRVWIWQDLTCFTKE